MVVIKGGGQTYSVGMGREMPWEDVPESFKKKCEEQKEIEKCVKMRAAAQQCISERGFWDTGCVELTEAFHLCQADELTRTELSHQQKKQQ